MYHVTNECEYRRESMGKEGNEEQLVFVYTDWDFQQSQPLVAVRKGHMFNDTI